MALLTELYRDGELIGRALEQMSTRQHQDRAGLAERRAALAKEIAQAERALDRYHEAFETGRLGAGRFAERVEPSTRAWTRCAIKITR